MKQIIVETPEKIRLKDMQDGAIVAYRSKNSENYCILTKLVQNNTTLERTLTKKEPYRYGFVPLNMSNSSPRFVANTWAEAVENAAKSRMLVTFGSMQELIDALYHKRF